MTMPVFISLNKEHGDNINPCYLNINEIRFFEREAGSPETKTFMVDLAGGSFTALHSIEDVAQKIDDAIRKLKGGYF